MSYAIKVGHRLEKATKKAKETGDAKSSVSFWTATKAGEPEF